MSVGSGGARLRSVLRWMNVAAVLAAALLVAVFVAGLINSNSAQLVAAGTGFAAVVAGWSSGYAVITSKLRADQRVSASSHP